MRMVLVMVHEERSHWGSRGSHGGSRRAHGGSRGNVVLVEGHKLMTRANIIHIQRANGVVQKYILMITGGL